MTDLRNLYKEKIAPQLMAEFGISNKMAVPRLEKVVINMGIKEMASDKGLREKMGEQMAMISGQKPKLTRAKKSIANFKLRQGDPIGLTVTLRGKRMYDFLTKLTRVVLPRMRDFQGVSGRGLDGKGNYTLGLAEQIVFPEIDSAKVEKIRGLEVTIVTTARDDKIGRRFLELVGVPFQRKKHGEDGKNS